MAEQSFNPQTKRFWIDLHKCATAEAEAVVAARLEECHRYGLETLEVIYGTPDNYEGSIEEAVKRLAGSSPYVERFEEVHAGIEIRIRVNDHPLLWDENVQFSAFGASYQRFRAMEFERDYYPFRKTFTTREIADEFGCAPEYVRSVVATLSREDASPVTTWNSVTRRNETIWEILPLGRNAVADRWKADVRALRDELAARKAGEAEVEAVLATLRTPVPEGGHRTRAKASLTRLRKKACPGKRAPRG